MTESTFRFHMPILTALDFVINPSYQRMEDEVCPVALLLQTNVSRNPDGRDARVELTVRINYDNDGNRKNDAPFWITVSYAARFSWDETLPDDMVDEMLRINAPSVLLSYIRPLVSQITSSTPFPTYNIPFLNLTKLREDASKAEKEN